MPSTSKKQARFMAAAAHNPAFAKKAGIPQSVAQEFNQADKGKKFRGGGMAKMKHDDLAEDKKLIKKAFGMHDKQEHPGKKTNLSKLNGGGMARISAKGEHPVQKQSKRGAEMIKMKKGGRCYDEGGEVEFETKTGQNEGASIDDDVRARAMKFLEKGESKSAAPKAPAPKAEAPAKRNPVQEAKDVVSAKGVSMPKSFEKAGGNTKASPAKADLSGFKMRLPDPLSKYDRYGKATGMKRGGSVSGASKRADGCAVKGKTKGRMI